jgi:hypothetical protein
MTNLMEALDEAKRSIDFPRHAALHAASEAEITRLRAENAALRAAGQAVVEWSEMSDLLRFNRGFIALRAALKEGGGA